MLEVLHSTMEVCEEAKDIILPWIDELKKRDFSLRPISAATASALSVLATDTFTAAAADAVQRSSRSRAEGGFRRGFCLRKTNTLGRLAEEEKDGLPSDSGNNGSGPSGTNSAPTPETGCCRSQRGRYQWHGRAALTRRGHAHDGDQRGTSSDQ